MTVIALCNMPLLKELKALRVDLLLGRTGGLRLKVHGNIRQSVDVSCRVGFSDSVPFPRLY